MDSEQFQKIFNVYKNLPRPAAIEKIPFPTRDEFFNYIAPYGKPYIFRGGINCNLNKAEVFDILSKNFGELNINIRLGDYSKPENYSYNRTYKQINLKSFIEELALIEKSGDYSYAGNQEIPVNLCKHLGVEYPQYYSSEIFRPPKLWFGPAGAVTPLHKDYGDNFIYHILGKKRWIIFSPLDVPKLKMKIIDRDTYPDFAVSSIDLRNLDGREGILDDISKFDLEIESGEIFYLPAEWPHYVENLEMSLTINFWINRELQPIGVFNMDK